VLPNGHHFKRQLDPDEKKQILKAHGLVCFATGHKIPPNETVNFDHIRAFAQGGVSELDNMPRLRSSQQDEGNASLEDFRISLRLKDFFKEGDTVTLQNLLEFLKKSKDITSSGAASA